MSFETKYLIRWGIPGWTFISMFALVNLINFPTYLDHKLISDVNILTIVGLLTALGVPLGYLFHQIYFALSWVFHYEDENLIQATTNQLDEELRKNIEDDYFKVETLWHAAMMDYEADKRDYITNRYRHLLSTVHSLGVLSLVFVVLIIYVFTLILRTTFYLENIFFIMFLIVFCICSFTNYKYFKKNKDIFMGSVLYINYENYFRKRDKS